MPYIPPADRPSLDDLVAQVVEELSCYEPLDRLGHLNYTLTRIVLGAMPRPPRYHWLVAYRGVLSDVKDEMGRRYVAKYEDIKARENGDVPEYSEASAWLS